MFINFTGSKTEFDNPEITFSEFKERLSGAHELPVASPAVRSAWMKHSKNISDHYFGEPLEHLLKNFPNEDPEIKEYRIRVFEPVTLAPILQAFDELRRVLRDSSFSINIENEEYELYLEKMPLRAWALSKWITSRILDPNGAAVVVPVVDSNTRGRIRVNVEIIHSCRILYNTENLFIYLEKGAKYDGGFSANESGGILRILHRNFIARLYAGPNKKLTFALEYETPGGAKKWVTNGGRPTVARDEYGEQYEVYATDFLAALPLLNRVMLYDNQETSINLSSAFPWKIVQGESCEACNGFGTVLPDSKHPAYNPEYPDKMVSCGTCKGHGKVFPASPLHGYRFRPKPEGMTSDERNKSMDIPPVDFISPNVDMCRYQGENKDRAEAKLNQVLNINRPVYHAQSAAAKEVDNQSLYTQVDRIGSEFLSNLEALYNNIISLVFMRRAEMPKAVTITKPVSFALKDEAGLMEELSVVVKDKLPQGIRFYAYKELLNRRFNDAKTKKIELVSICYSPFYIYTIEERDSLRASGAITMEETQKAARAFQTVKLWADQNPEEFSRLSVLEIVEKIDGKI